MVNGQLKPHSHTYHTAQVWACPVVSKISLAYSDYQVILIDTVGVECDGAEYVEFADIEVEVAPESETYHAHGKTSFVVRIAASPRSHA